VNPATAGLVALCGGLGCLARYAAGVAADRALGRSLPWGTLGVNLAGSLLIGVAVAYFAARGQLDGRARIAVTTGFLGGFTTYSTFAYETVALVERDRLAAAALYLTSTLAGGALACVAGMWLVRRFG
jgi:fluoride exporter